MVEKFCLTPCHKYPECDHMLCRTATIAALSADLAKRDERIKELEREKAYAEDAATKGDLARQNAGGMELRISALESDLAQLVKELDEAQLQLEHPRKQDQEFIEELRKERDEAVADVRRLKAEQVEWVVNDIAELGVKIGDQFFFLYKGRSLVYESRDDADDGRHMQYRPVWKREFGECCHPVNYKNPHLIGTVSLGDSDDWKPITYPVAALKEPK